MSDIEELDPEEIHYEFARQQLNPPERNILDEGERKTEEEHLSVQQSFPSGPVPRYAIQQAEKAINLAGPDYSRIKKKHNAWIKHMKVTSNKGGQVQ